MEQHIEEKLSIAIEKGIKKTLDDNPGIEKYLDWFTLLAPVNEAMDQVSQDINKEALV